MFRIDYKTFRDEENFQFVPPEQKKRFVKKKKDQKPEGIFALRLFTHSLFLDEKKPTSTKDVTAEGGAKPKQAKKAAKKVAKKEESDDEIKPFPDFLKKSDDEAEKPQVCENLNLLI